MNFRTARALLITGSSMQRTEWGDPGIYLRLKKTRETEQPEFELHSPASLPENWSPNDDDLAALDWELVRTVR